MPDNITVYVRQGGHDQERQISFHRPERIPESDLRRAGATVRGHECVVSVYPREFVNLATGEREGYYLYEFAPEQGASVAPTLWRAIAEAESNIVTFFKERGYEVRFAA